MVKIRRFAPYILTVFATVVIFLISGELFTRGYHYFVYKYGCGKDRVSIIQENRCLVVLDEKMGWRVIENYRFNSMKKDAAGRRYLAKVETNRYGFREFGAIYTTKKKILLIGDSFTNASQISNDKTYYGIIKNILPVEVFAYGGGGYGTLQEYMILDEYVDVIKPDIIIWQYCSNDFINNDYDLEANAVQNNSMRRPCLDINGSIYYDIPIKNKTLAKLREFINSHSQFLCAILGRMDTLMLILHSNKNDMKSSSEGIIASEGSKNAAFRRSEIITCRLMKMARDRCRNIRMLAFSSNMDSPCYETFKRISRLNNIEFMDGIPQAVDRSEQGGVVTRAADNGHWSESGHKIVAEEIIKYIKENNILSQD